MISIKKTLIVITAVFIIQAFLIINVYGVSCGDGNCELEETCVTCSPDCGICKDDKDENYPEHLKSIRNQASEADAKAQEFAQSQPASQIDKQPSQEATQQTESTSQEKLEKLIAAKKKKSNKSPAGLFIIFGGILLFLIWVLLIIAKKSKEKKEAAKEAIEAETQKHPETTIQPLQPQNIESAVASYIKTNLEKGFTKEQLKSAFIKQGWNRKDIDEILRNF